MTVIQFDCIWNCLCGQTTMRRESKKHGRAMACRSGWLCWLRLEHFPSFSEFERFLHVELYRIPFCLLSCWAQWQHPPEHPEDQSVLGGESPGAWQELPLRCIPVKLKTTFYLNIPHLTFLVPSPLTLKTTGHPITPRVSKGQVNSPYR